MCIFDSTFFKLFEIFFLKPGKSFYKILHKILMRNILYVVTDSFIAINDMLVCLEELLVCLEELLFKQIIFIGCSNLEITRDTRE